MAKTLDRLDRRILEELQLDARISNQELAKRVGLSPAPCWRRLRRLEEAGFIAGYATLLQAPAIGLPILAYALVSLENHHPESVRQFDQFVKERAGGARVPLDERPPMTTCCASWRRAWRRTSTSSRRSCCSLRRCAQSTPASCCAPRSSPPGCPSS